MRTTQIKRVPATGTPQKTTQHHNSSIKTRIKVLVMGAYCWGYLPLRLMDWIIRRGGLRDE
jgi:hypothetical protein